MIDIEDLRTLRGQALTVAVVACVLGLGSALAMALLDAAATPHLMAVLSQISLVSVAVVLAAISYVWIPAHDQVLHSIRSRRAPVFKLANLSKTFTSAETVRSIRPPRSSPN